jgi:hypothetical protein
MKNVLSTVGWVLAGIALVASFSIDLANTARGGSADMRNRITGARLLEHGINPYRYLWRAGDPPEFCDLRNNPHLTVSKTTVTPALLLLHAPLAALPYRQAQFVWLFGQWALLLGTVWLWWRACANPLLGWQVVLFVTGFTYTQAWRWHAERGQSYVPLVFLLACWLTTTLHSKRGHDFLPGALAGFLVALRPPFLLLLPFLALHRRGQGWGAVAGLVLGFGLPLLINPSCWTDYFSAMQTHSDDYRHAWNPPRGDQAFPPEIEGTPTSVLSHMALYPFGDLSIYADLRRFGLAPIPTWPPLGGFALLFALWLALTARLPVERLLPGLAAWLFLADLVLPTSRYSYYDIIILNVVLAGLVTTGKFPWAAWPCALALPFGWALYAFSPVPNWLLYLPACLLTFGALLFLFPAAPPGTAKETAT